MAYIFILMNCKLGLFAADTSYTATRLGRVSAALSQEYRLLMFLQNVSNLSPSWDSHTPACQWDGVNCNQDGEVTDINWAGKKLEGTLDWKSLPESLLELRLYSNRLSGSIVLGDLPRNLRYFSVGSNKFSGSINLQKAPKAMERLLAGDNKLSGPVYFDNLPPNLSFLYLSRNAKLSGSVDGSILPCRLKNGSLYIDGSYIVYSP